MEVYPRDERHRYRLYVRRGDELTVLATAPDAGGLGQAIVTLHLDEMEATGRRLYELGRIGVLDAVAGVWIILPWERGERVTTFAPTGALIAP